MCSWIPGLALLAGDDECGEASFLPFGEIILLLMVS